MKIKFAYTIYLITIIAIALIVTRESSNIQTTSNIQEITQSESFIKAQSIKQSFISSETAGTAEFWWDYRIVAHALGSIEAHRATNSLEAMAINYTEYNIKLFEVDLILTSDDRLVARHDWQAYLYDLLGQTSSKGKSSVPLSYEEFKNLYSFGKYEPLDIETLILILQNHKDIYIITDTKYMVSENISKQFQILVDAVYKIDSSILDRLVIQIYSRQMYDLVTEIYPFKNIIYAVYANSDSQKEIINFCKEKEIGFVAIPTEKFNSEFVESLTLNGIKAYIHTVNTEEEKDILKNIGVWGIYSDYLTGPW